MHKLGSIPPFLASINRSPTQPRVFCTKSLVAYGFSHRTTVMFTPAFVGCWQYPVLVDEIPKCHSGRPRVTAKLIGAIPAVILTCASTANL